MTLILSKRDGPGLKQCWRQQVASQQRRRVAQGPRPLAAVTYLVRRSAHEGLVDIRDLTVVIMYDDKRHDGSVAIRCAGYSASGIPWGLKIGGADACKFDKDLTVAPAPAAKDRRFDTSNGELLSLALSCDQQLERHGRYPHFPRRLQPRWPKLWAGFAAETASQIELAGPEFEADYRRSTGSVIQSLARTSGGLTLYPLPYVSHAWRQILMIFVDMKTVPKRQVIALEPNARNLRGYDGAMDFDLVSSRFTATATIRRRTIRRQHKASVSTS